MNRIDTIPEVTDLQPFLFGMKCFERFDKVLAVFDKCAGAFMPATIFEPIGSVEILTEIHSSILDITE
jgi:hypothetical protein